MPEQGVEQPQGTASSLDLGCLAEGACPGTKEFVFDCDTSGGAGLFSPAALEIIPATCIFAAPWWVFPLLMAPFPSTLAPSSQLSGVSCELAADSCFVSS